VSYYTDVRDWHHAFAVPIADQPTPLAPDRLALRLDLMAEERDELDDALKAGDIAGAAKEAADEIVTVLGTMAEMGIPFDAVWAAVLASIHSKAGPDGEIFRRLDGKILKGPLYFEADIAAILAAPVLTP
jgi:predicted HAD superfamily Cof-like phosphohydrolase